MPNSRKRHVHQTAHHHTALPAKPNTRGRLIWALLGGVFGLLIGFFATTEGYIAPLIGCILGIAVGYAIGKNMEQQLKP